MEIFDVIVFIATHHRRQRKLLDIKGSKEILRIAGVLGLSIVQYFRKPK
jgi:hypothetical protein